ncbi:MAG: histidine phosphatase family protein, partial [Proteobacteria bacterium]|nr:histidine phosphatase family protein [Pseudomonadota bacterium]
NQGREVCVIGHAGVNRVLLAKLLGMPMDRVFRLDQEYACLNLIDVFEDGIPLVRTLNQRAID